MKLFREGGQGSKGPAWRFMERFDIPAVDAPEENHLVRYRIVQTPWFALYVHRFDRPDVRTFHDHPWHFTSLIVRGGYVEASPENWRSDGLPVIGRARLRQLRAGTVNRKRATDLHYITDLLRRPTWTVMVVGRRHRTWGYVDEAGWTPFDQHAYAAKFDAAVAARRVVRADTPHHKATQ